MIAEPESAPQPRAVDEPFASVVVPTYRRPDLLSRCLKALLRQEVPPGSLYEIVVADDAASVATREQVEYAARFASTGGRQVRLRYVAVTGGAHGPAAARNRGWRAAQSRVIAFTDDDTMPEPNWLIDGVRRFQPGVVAVWGRLIVPVRNNPTDYELNTARLAEAEFVTANCFCLKEALEQVGGFDERYRRAWREDSDLYFALQRLGRPIVHAPEAVVVHPVRPGRWGVSITQQRNSVFDALLFKKYPTLFREKLHADTPWRYYVIVLAGVIALGAWRHPPIAWTAFAVWAALTVQFTLQRLKGTSRRPTHVAEMIYTSIVIPPVALLWRWIGAWRFRVLFL